MHLYNKNNNFFHGVMFHHFHDNKKHHKSQGSIDKDDFYKLIKFIGRKNILNADDFYNRFKERSLKGGEYCFTFDDGLKCQYDLALPVLEELNIKAYFFIYTSIFTSDPDLLEVYRHFRMNCFDCIDLFYEEFFRTLPEIKDNKDFSTFLEDNEFKIKDMKEAYNFYSSRDIQFRLTRDYYLTLEEYRQLMLLMFKNFDFDYQAVLKDLFLTKENVKYISSLNHVIGLHSHNHPTKLELLSFEVKKNEYVENKNLLEEIIEKKINSASHPLGSYDQKTLKTLRDLGIKIGFRDNMKIDKEKNMNEVNNSSLELAREDHTNILNFMNAL
jgi:peptidoglycan/xylan/chitin deacetylase (PgdA/CDA1 family)